MSIWVIINILIQFIVFFFVAYLAEGNTLLSFFNLGILIWFLSGAIVWIISWKIYSFFVTNYGPPFDYYAKKTGSIYVIWFIYMFFCPLLISLLFGLLGQDFNLTNISIFSYE